ncbi:hypothetical protein [Paenibacillus sp. DMB20]|uniref:hypothetical protein n=1 Tax=Paenibacillus sp. DMB20 TaxID=1642570 RepID=UPI00128CEEC7|nr:hypothetical protein [Paenibacillus sp. DMB20]
MSAKNHPIKPYQGGLIFLTSSLGEGIKSASAGLTNLSPSPAKERAIMCLDDKLRAEGEWIVSKNQ